MLIVLIYYVSLSILQILYVTGVSISWSSPSTLYSSISSKSVPIYSGNVQQESSTIKPFRISGSTLTSLKQIDNLDTEMLSDRGLAMNTNKIIINQNGQLKNNNDDGMSKYTITNTQPSELNNESSQSSKISNFNIPIQFNGPRLSNIYHETNKISETGQINDVSNLYKSNNDADIGLDTSFGSIQFDRIGRAGESGGEKENNKGFSGSKGSISFNNKNKGRRVRPGGEEDGGRLNESKKFVEENDGGIEGHGVEESGGSGSGGFIGFGKKNEGGSGLSGVEEGENKGFGGSKGFISFNNKNKGRRVRPGGEEDGGRLNESKKFVEENDGGIEGYGVEESGGSGSGGFIGFGRKNEGGSGLSGVEEGGNKGFGGSKGSISFNNKNKGRRVRPGGEEDGGRLNESKKFVEENDGGIEGYGVEESGGSGSGGFIGFGRKNEGGSGLSGVEEGGNKGFGGSKGSISFNNKNKGRRVRPGGEEDGGRLNESKKFVEENDGGIEGHGVEESGGSGSGGFIGFGKKNEGGSGLSGVEEGENKGFGGSKGFISFNNKNKGRRVRPGGEEDGGRLNESKKFVEENDGGIEGYGVEESGGSGSGGFIGFGRKNEGGSGLSGVEEGGNKGFGGSKGSISFNNKNKGRRVRPGGEEDGGILNESKKFVEENDGGIEGHGVEKSGGSGSGGFIGFSRKNEGGSGLSGVEEGENKGFGGSKGSISFNNKNKGKRVRPGGEKDGGRLNKSKKIVEENDGGIEGYGVEESRGSGSGGFIGFSRRNEGWTGGSGGEEKGNIEFSGSKGSIRFGSKDNGRTGGYNGEKSGGSGSGGFIRFGRKNEGGASGSGGEEKGNKGFSGSKGSIRFGSKRNGRAGGSGVEKKGGIRFSGSNGSIRFDGKNEGRIGKFGENNIKIRGGHRANRSSRSRNIGGKKNFKLSIGGVQLGKENRELSRSDSVLKKITGKNYGSRRFGGNSNSNKFVGDNGENEVGSRKSFGEKMNMFSKTGGIYDERKLDDYNENNRSVKEYGTGEVIFGEYSNLGNNSN